MPSTIFVPRLSIPYREGPTYSTALGGVGGGLDVAVSAWPSTGKFVAQGDLWLPQADVSETYDTFLAFFKAAKGRGLPFLYAPTKEPNGKSVAEAVGTGNASETKFALDFLFPRTGTFTITVAGTPKTEGVDWSLSKSDGSAWTPGSGTPYLKFGSAPAGAAAIVATYWYMVPVRFDRDDLLEDLVERAPGATSAGSVFFLSGVRLVQDSPGSHLVTPIA